MLGYMLLFNGFCITLLAYLTELGVTNETLAKWSELDARACSTSACASRRRLPMAFGLAIILAGAVVTGAGFVLGRSSSK